MSDTCVDRRRRTGVLLQTLLCWIFIELCCAGHRPYERGERQRYARLHDRWGQRIQYPSLHDQGTQRIEYPSVNDEGTQRVHYPSVHDRGQTILYPSVNDSSAGFQIQVKISEDVTYLVVEGMLFYRSCRLHFTMSQVWLGGDLRTFISGSKGHATARLY